MSQNVVLEEIMEEIMEKLIGNSIIFLKPSLKDLKNHTYQYFGLKIYNVIQ